MATAETNSRRQEDESVSNETVLSSEHGSASRSKQKSSRSTRQLDFFQAMSDFHAMFPTMEDDVIEAVLRANDGAVDATIDQLLTMSIDAADGDDGIDAAIHAAVVPAFCPEYKEHADDGAKAAGKDSPPSYSEAMRSNTETSIWTTPIQSTPATAKVSSLSTSLSTSPARNLLDLGLGDLPITNAGRKSPQGISANSGQGFLLTRNNSSGCFSTGSVQGGNSANTQIKKVYKNWNPPMLGTLPDDFLRIMPLDSPTWAASSETSEKSRIAGLSTSPINVMSLSDAKPKVHKSRSKSEKISRSFSATSKDVREKDLRSRHSEKKSSEKMKKALSLVDEQSTPERSHSHKVSRSNTCGGRSRHRDMNSSRSPTHCSMVLATHDFSAGMLEERMKENERRRKKTSIADDPELIQYLEDEKLAIALQNSEFLQELRGNEDFMKTLERDRMNVSAFGQAPHSPTPPSPKPPSPQPPPPQMPPPRPGPIPLPSSAIAGYGEDNQQTLEPFPFSQPIAAVEKEDDIELRRQLKQMGKASRTKFAALAKKFFKRKKKNHRLILNEKLAPSTMNLLDNGDDEDDDVQFDPRYDRSPDIEPLPSTLSAVPSHRTVQRPAYNPDGVTTHFDNRHTDIV